MPDDAPPGSKVQPLLEQFKVTDQNLVLDATTEPEQVRNLWTDNILRRVIAHLVGTSDHDSKFIRATPEGALSVMTEYADYTTSITGDAPDTITQKYTTGTARIGVLVTGIIWDYEMIIQCRNTDRGAIQTFIWPPGVPIRILSRFNELWLGNYTGGLTARYYLNNHTVWI